MNPNRAEGSGGLFNSVYATNGGAQVLGNTFNANGGPMYFENGSGVDNTTSETVYDVPEYIFSKHFTGTNDELRQVGDAISKMRDKSFRQCIIHGMHGVGKTQLALRYVMSQRSKTKHIMWISAASGASFTEDVINFVNLIHLAGRHAMNPPEKISAARNWLETTSESREWLTVLDNISEETMKKNTSRLLATTKVQK